MAEFKSNVDPFIVTVDEDDTSDAPMLAFL